MTTQIGIRELRDTLTAVIRRVRAGETIEITHHGAPVAVLAPAPANRLERLMATREVTRPRPLDHPVKRHRVTGDRTASQAIEDDRAER